jgi:hypothetical protein
MRHLRSVQGSGQLFAGENALGPAKYDVDLWEDPNGFKEAGGELVSDPTTLAHAFNAAQNGEKLTLALSDGTKATIIIREHTIGDDIVDIVVSGPFPGL